MRGMVKSVGQGLLLRALVRGQPCELQAYLQ